MRHIGWGTLLLLVSSPSFASDAHTARDVTITIEQPKQRFLLGEPIWLTVTFRSALRREVLIRGFAPEIGSSFWGSARISSNEGILGTRYVRATTNVVVERLSGSPVGFTEEITLGCGCRSFNLAAGASQTQSFDLMQTLGGAVNIDSPGRFRISLDFTVVATTSEGWEDLRDPPEWEGRVRAQPVEIRVVRGDNHRGSANKPSPARSASRITAAP